MRVNVSGRYLHYSYSITQMPPSSHEIGRKQKKQKQNVVQFVDVVILLLGLSLVDLRHFSFY